MRIHKFIADCGICSRRAAEVLVRNGKVIVNNKPATIGMDIDPENDRITCEGKRIYIKSAEKQYFMFYKPRGVITAMKAQDDRKVLAELIKGIKGRVYPVGRLDRDSEGMLILTDDGELAVRLMHPRHHISKTYRVTISGDVSDELLEKMRTGISLDDGVTTLPAEVYIQSQSENKTVLHITLYEGKNRQIRRMCEELNLEILLLKRICISDVMLGHLSPGEYRPLTIKEKTKLLEAVGLKTPDLKKPSTKTNAIFSKVKMLSHNQFKNNKTSTKSIHEKRFLKQFKDK
ncbi:MAG: ribosomal large subunit pseudouridine synthase [Clostridia bacterium]|nr:ribosomal large subunit pseudouridine synthase [Clostridia bacterium]